MRTWQRASDRALPFGLSSTEPLPSTGSNNRGFHPSRSGASSSDLFFSSSVMTLSELARLDAAQATPSAEVTPVAHVIIDGDNGDRRRSSSATRYVDVDALDDEYVDNASTQRIPSQLNLSIGSRSRNSEWAATTTVAVSPVVPAALHHLVRDSVVLAYRDGLSNDVLANCGDPSYRALADSSFADELLAVAVDDSHIFLRRGGRVKTLNSDQSQTNASMLSLRVWNPDSVGEDENEAHNDRSSNSLSRSTYEKAARSCKDTVPVYSTQWKEEASVLLPHVQTPLSRVRPRGGAQSSTLLYSNNDNSNNGSGHGGNSRCQAEFVALSSAAVSLVHARDSGAVLTLSQYHSFDREMVVNATCMDDWGTHCTVVGFSDGTLRVVDWRMPSTSVPLPFSAAETRPSVDDYSNSGLFSALVTRVPQPHWLSTRRRNGLVLTSVAGVLSCCSLADSFRVVCGLGDASGAVVVADLRKPGAPADRKRGRRSKVEQQTDALLFSEVGGLAPTGRAVTDICHNPRRFGQIGLVDITGVCVLTHLSVLEGTRDATCDSLFVPGRGSERIETEIGAGSSTSPASSSFSNAPRRRARLPSPPSPWQVLARTERVTTTASSERNSAPFIAGRLPPRSLPAVSNLIHPRCLFTSDGSYCVHTETGRSGNGGSMGAALQSLDPFEKRYRGTLPLQSGLGRATHLRLSLQAAQNPTASTTSFVAVSSVDRLVCFDTSNGNSLSLLLN